MLRDFFRKIVNFFKNLWLGTPTDSGDVARPSSGPFEDYLTDTMNAKTARKVVATFKKLQLPLPQEGDFLKGTEGALVFLNRYGVTLRIEKAQPEFTENIIRLNHNPLVLQPIASIRAQDAIFEICPGTHSDNRERDSDKIKKLLKKVGVDFWDDGAHNVGRLPVTTPQFPEGIPIVIDRLAVARLSERVAPAKQLLKLMGLTEDPQVRLYGPLAAAFREAWKSKQDKPARIAEFWNKCAATLEKGKLINGWNEHRDDTYKISDAKRDAKNYDRAFGPAG